MATICIRFEERGNNKQAESNEYLKNGLKNVVFNILTRITPKANPDFEIKFSQVNHWLVECNTENGVPEREIGLDATGQTIMKMPYKNNLGYWTDNNLLLNDLKGLFEIRIIKPEAFDYYWKTFQLLPE
jgi:hypothetical protein